MKSKSELLKIYEKAKKVEYDLQQLDLKEIKLLNSLISAEIEIKERKLNELKQ